MRKQLLKLVFFLGLLSNAPTIMAQTGVAINDDNTNPNPSAMLDVKSTTKGLLIPRLTAAQKTAVAAPATGLLIYQTDAIAGFYYYNGVAWIWLSSGWHLTGNAGTVDGTNFIGTTDNVPLNFRVNNQKAGRIDQGNGLVFLGVGAGNVNTSGSINTFIGASAGAANTSGSSNTAVGGFSFFSNTTGLNNTAVGKEALRANTGGSSNTAIGYMALLTNTTGIENTAVGYESMLFNLTGQQNSAVGYRSLRVNTTGNYNNAFGNFGLSNNTTGSHNTAVGYGAVGANTIGNSNVGLGNYALATNSTSMNNTAVGYSAINKATSTDNAAVGAYALQNTSTGAFNSALGSNSGSTNTTGSSNTTLGNNAGFNNVTGSNNTFIGANTSANNTGINNATAVGANTVVVSSNTVILGANANVGIGTSTPGEKLQVVGKAVFTATNTPLTGTTSAAYIRGRDGFSTAATPDYTWYNSDQTGFFHPAGTVIGFSVNGFGEVMRIMDNRIGIGTTIPNGQFELSLDQGRKPGTSAWTIASDARLKNINGNYNKGLTELMQLQAIKYNYKNVGERTFPEEVLNTEFVGFSAQNVQTVFPEAVTKDEDGFLSLNLHAVWVAYLNALKELKTENDAMKAENIALKVRLEALEAENKDIKADVQAIKAMLENNNK